MCIPLVDLKAQYNSIKTEIDQAIVGVIENGQFVSGPEVEAFEEEISAYLGVAYSVGVASGTDAIHLALLACGVETGDEVITTPFTFIATAEAITRCGATPVFADIDSTTYNIDPTKIESKINRRTKAILPVHLYGRPAEMAPILELSKRYDLKVVEDCAQALGAKYKGKKVGSLGDAGCLSFFPSKTLGAYGDGGMVVTDNPDIANRIKLLRNHGSQEKYHCVAHGFNSRLDSIQATILRVKLRYLRDWIRKRQECARVYARLLGMMEWIAVPYKPEHSTHTYNYYTIRVNHDISRSHLINFLSNNGISTAIYYPRTLHLQEVYKDLGYTVGDFLYSEQAQDEVLSLPMYPELEMRQIELIVDKIRDFVAQGERVK